jgi:hypothetical protein
MFQITTYNSVVAGAKGTNPSEPCPQFCWHRFKAYEREIRKRRNILIKREPQAGCKWGGVQK